MNIDFIFLLGAVLFLIAALYFYLERKSLISTLNLLVCFSASFSYLVMSLGLGSEGMGLYTAYPTRWLFYIASCSFLIYEVARILNKSKETTLKMVVMNVFVMLSGYLAAMTDGSGKWIMFGLGCVAFTFILVEVFTNVPKTKFAQVVKWYVPITWMLFPVIFIFSPSGTAAFTAMTTLALYFVLDVTTKIIFGYLSLKNEK